MTTSLRSIAKMIDHSLLHPTMSGEELRDGCDVALACDVASVCIKPNAVPMAVKQQGNLPGEQPAGAAYMLPAGPRPIAYSP